MKRTFALLLALLLAFSCALAEETAADDETIAVGETTGAAAAGFEPIPWDETKSPNVPDPDCYLPDDAGYHDDSIDVRIETFHSDNGTLCYAMYVTIVDPSQLRTGTQASRAPYKATALVSKMAARFNAVCAINDDYFGYHNEGIVYRNGKQIRMNPSIRRDELIIDENGDFHVITGTTREKWEA